jgi:phosphatidylserine decarboxylase
MALVAVGATNVGSIEVNVFECFYSDCVVFVQFLLSNASGVRYSSKLNPTSLPTMQGQFPVSQDFRV